MQNLFTHLLNPHLDNFVSRVILLFLFMLIVAIVHQRHWLKQLGHVRIMCQVKPKGGKKKSRIRHFIGMAQIVTQKGKMRTFVHT